MNNLSYTARSAGQKAKGSIPTTEKWVEQFARFGYAAKGAIYIIIGILAAMAAFGASGGKTTDSQGAFQEIIQQPFGKILLGIVAVGLVGYMVWRFIQAIRDVENQGDDTKGIAVRTGYFISGLIHGFLAFTAFKMIAGSSQGSGGGQQTFIDKLLAQPAGQWIVGLLALIVIGKGIYQIYKGYTNKFSEDVQDGHVKREIKDVYQTAGKWGFVARGVVFAIIGYFLMQAAITANPSEAGGTKEAFSFLSAAGGPWLMGLVALGLIGYGVFQIVKAKYKAFKTV